MNTRYSKQLNRVLDLSQREATRLHSANLEPAHLLLGMLCIDECGGVEILRRRDVDIQVLRQRTEEWIKKTVSNTLMDGAMAQVSRATEKLLRLTLLESLLCHDQVADTRHLLLAMLRDRYGEVCKILRSEHILYETVRKQMDDDDGPSETLDDDNDDDEGFDVMVARFCGYNENNDDDDFDLDNDDLDDEEDDYLFDDDFDDDDEEEDLYDYQSVTGHEQKKSVASYLDTFGFDVTKAAADGLLDPVIGRDNEILRVSQILSRRKKNNPILIGQSGVGKSSVVEGLAIRIVKRQVPRALFDKRIYLLDLTSIVAGTKYRGQFEERLRNIVREVQSKKNIILFIDEIHIIVGAGSAVGTMDAANILKPVLSHGSLQCIGTTTIDEYHKSIEKDGALERRFQKVLVEPTTKDDTLQILKNLREKYEEHHNVHFTDEALEACINLADRYIGDRSFPDKAIDVMDESGARAHINDWPVNEKLNELESELGRIDLCKAEALQEKNFAKATELQEQSIKLTAQINEERKRWETQLDSERLTVDESDVANVVSQMTGVPVQRIDQSDMERLRGLRGQLQAAVVGQDDAIDCVVRAIQRNRVGLKDPAKPIGTFMFLGPTGVGKTYLTKRLAEVMFGSKDALIRLDMSEFIEKHNVSRLVGAPPGYVGYDDGGQLTEQVRRHPYSILLLDEIEKAHPDVFNILLQVMDEGRLTDGNGTTVDFRNTIIIMTSNCGTRQLKDFGRGVGFGAQSSVLDNKSGRDVIQKALDRQFAPEFLNRLDEIVFFNPLSKDSILKMVDLALAPIQQRVSDMGYTLVLDDSAKAFIATKGYNAQYGARPLARAMQTHIENNLCELVMNDAVKEGQTIIATVQDDKIVLTIENKQI